MDQQQNNLDPELSDRSSAISGQPILPPVMPSAGIFNFAAAEDDLYEVEVSNEPPLADDESSVYSEMEQSEDEDDMEAADGVVDMSHCLLGRHQDGVYAVAIHPTKPDCIVTGGGDDKAYLCTFLLEEPTSEDEGAECICVELSGHSDTVTSVGFNFDGTLLLTASYDGTVRIWDAIHGTSKRILSGPEDVEWAQWHSKGNAIVAGSKDGTIWMWLAHDGQCVQVFAGHDGGVSAGCFSSDGKFVVSGGEDGTVRLWAPKTGQCKHVFGENTGGHGGLVTCISSSTTDEDMILTGTSLYLLYTNLISLYFFKSFIM